MSDEKEVLFPAKQVRLLSGRYVTIEPWGLDEGELLMPRVAALMVQLREDWTERNVAKIIREHVAEVREIVRVTVGWTEDEMRERLKYEDVFTLAQGVLEVCLMRGQDFGGVVGKVLALAVQRDPQGENSPAPSSSSSPQGTPGPTSASTPPSR